MKTDDLTASGFERIAGMPAPGELRAARLTDGSAICLGNSDGQLFALRDACSHAGFPLSEGSLEADGVLQCAWHGARFECQTGHSLDNPPYDAVPRFDVHAADGAVWVRRSPATAGEGP